MTQVLSRRQSATTCRWSTPTLFMATPYWLEAETSPWTCVRDAAPRVLALADECRTCPRFETAPPPSGHLHPERPDFFR
jgi:hypothetical protein